MLLNKLSGVLYTHPHLLAHALNFRVSIKNHSNSCQQYLVLEVPLAGHPGTACLTFGLRFWECERVTNDVPGELISDL